MKFLTRLATGQIALWFTFWLIGMPLALVWDISGGCMVVGCGIEQPFIATFFIVLFALSSAAVPFISLALWRSASNYPRDVWWHGPVAWGAKICAVLTGLAAVLSLLAIIYFVITFIYAAVVIG